MLAYNKTQARIRAWTQKINAVSTERQALKKELLTILNNPDANFYRRIATFTDRKKELLSEGHAQGWVWKPHFNWFYTLLSPLFSLFNKPRPQSGSRLRTVLTEEPDIPELSRWTLNDYKACDALEISEAHNYEEALFSESTEALADLKQRFSTLTQDTQDSDLQELLDRLYALKYRLDPLLYQHHLENLFTNYPKQTTQYFYKIYQDEHYDTPEKHDFVELHLLARALMDNFVLNKSDIHVHNHSELYLLILLSVSEQKIYSTFTKQDPVEILLKTWNTSFREFDVFQKELLDSLFTADELNVRASRRKASTEENSPEGLTETLKDIFEKHNPQVHPLLHHFARLSLEQLFLDYNKPLEKNESRDLIWKPGHHGFDTIHFIVKKIIKTTAIKRLDDFQNQQDMLDPTNHDPIPSDMKSAEKYAIEFILRQAREEDKICLERAQNIQQKLSETEISWIISRVSHVAPDLGHNLQRIFAGAIDEPENSGLPSVRLKREPSHSGRASQIGFYSGESSSGVANGSNNPNHDAEGMVHESGAVYGS